jgi:hypothetical protein
MSQQYRVGILLITIIALEFFILAIVCNNSTIAFASVLESIGCSALSIHMALDVNEVIP